MKLLSAVLLGLLAILLVLSSCITNPIKFQVAQAQAVPGTYTFKVQISPPAARTIKITVWQGPTIAASVESLSALDGGYETSWTFQPGSYTAQAEAVEDNTYKGATSSIVSFSVDKFDSTVTITVVKN